MPSPSTCTTRPTPSGDLRAGRDLLELEVKLSGGALGLGGRREFRLSEGQLGLGVGLGIGLGLGLGLGLGRRVGGRRNRSTTADDP